jgi:hypothetical protein
LDSIELIKYLKHCMLFQFFYQPYNTILKIDSFQFLKQEKAKSHQYYHLKEMI